ncbi:hypothetical protein BaRGS_00021154 [Batillaria attramentaria]|uniref:Uncharacterized protein n=1 Tax=Batillaria attramentaria TaxID=370345 RepID=A0ABD0KKC0_9CAEN
MKKFPVPARKKEAFAMGDGDPQKRDRWKRRLHLESSPNSPLTNLSQVRTAQEREAAVALKRIMMAFHDLPGGELLEFSPWWARQPEVAGKALQSSGRWCSHIGRNAIVSRLVFPRSSSVLAPLFRVPCRVLIPFLFFSLPPPPHIPSPFLLKKNNKKPQHL